MITISWHNDRASESLKENIAMKVIFYERDMQDIQLRRCGEFRKAMHQMGQRYRDDNIPAEGTRILPLER